MDDIISGFIQKYVSFFVENDSVDNGPHELDKHDLSQTLANLTFTSQLLEHSYGKDAYASVEVCCLPQLFSDVVQ